MFDVEHNGRQFVVYKTKNGVRRVQFFSEKIAFVYSLQNMRLIRFGSPDVVFAVYFESKLINSLRVFEFTYLNNIHLDLLNKMLIDESFLSSFTKICLEEMIYSTVFG